MKTFAENADTQLNAIEARRQHAEELLSQVHTCAGQVDKRLAELEREYRVDLQSMKAARGNVIQKINESERRAVKSSQQLNEKLQGRFEKARQEQQALVDLALVDLTQALKQVQEDCRKATKGMVTSAEEFRRFLQTEYEKWCVEQRTEFQRFADRHHSELEQMTSAYERQKVVYDSLKIAIQTTEDLFQTLSNKVQTDINCVREEVLNERAATTHDVEQQLRAFQTQVDRRVNAQLDSLKQLKHQCRRNVRLLWLAIGAVCGIGLTGWLALAAQTL